MNDENARAEQNESALGRKLFVLGLPVALRDSARACFPQFAWIAEDVAEARFRTVVSAKASGAVPAERQPHAWLSELSSDDLVAFWDGAISSVPTAATRLSLERGAFCDPETPPSLSLGSVNLVLRSVDDVEVQELADAKVPRFRIGGGSTSPRATTADDHDILVVARRTTLLWAIENFPGRRITAFTTGKQPLAIRMRWLDSGIRVIQRADQIAALIGRANEVVTDVAEVAAAGVAAGLPATFVGNSEMFDKVRADLSGASGAPAYYGFADVGSGATLTAEAVEARLSKIIGSAAEGPVDALVSPSDMTHIVIGQPKRGVKPINWHFGPAAYSNGEHSISKADFETNADQFSNCDLVVCADAAVAESWIKLDVPNAKRVLAPLPLDSPQRLNLVGGFVPMFGCHRVEQDGAGLRFALAADVDALSETDRADYAEQGRLLRPLLARLQTSGRLARLNKFEMGRKFGPIGYERVLVLGGDDAGGLIESNPRRVADLDVLKAALNARRHAKVLYAPTKKGAADVSHIAAAKALDPRVEIVSGSFSIAEFAHVVCEVHTVDSPLGVFALAAGLKLFVHGQPFYAGLGVTVDVAPSGASQAPAVANPLDLDTFLGWYFRTNVFCADALSGEPIPIETLATYWSPYLGELDDELADRLFERAVDPATSAADLRQLVRVLDKHGRRARLAQLIAKIDLAGHIASGHAIVFDVAREYALQGMWQDSVTLIFAVWRRHGEPMLAKVADALVMTRALLNSSAEIDDFEYFVLSKFRSLSGSQIRKIGDAFSSKRYFRSALSFYSSCVPSKQLLAARAECLIGVGDVEAAGALIEELVSQGEDALVVERLRVEWLRRTNRLEEILPILRKQTEAAAMGDADLTLQLAKLHYEIGNLDKAIELFSFLVRSRLGTQAVRNLASIYIGQMQTAKARGLLRAQLDIAPIDAQSWRLLGDTYSFENDLKAAGDCYHTALTLAPLDFASHARLVEIEEELAKTDGGPGRWTAALDELVTSVDQPSVETLIGHGRARLRYYDFATIKQNCLRAIALFPEDSRGHYWYGHACAWEMSEKSPEGVAAIRKSYQIALARDRDDMIGTILDAIRSLAKIGDIDGIRLLVHEHNFALFFGNKEKLDVARYSASMVLGDYLGVFEAMRYLQRTRVLKRNPKHFRFVTSIDEVDAADNLLLLSEGGVGDEMRCSTMYPELVKRFPKATISVDERLYPLFQRTFPKVKRFVPLRRYHRSRINIDMMATIGELPEQAFAPLFDNNLWREARHAVVLPVQCTLADLRRSDDDFAAGQKVRFIPRADLVEQWRERLRPYADQLIVGATWTSMYRDYQRIESYLTHEEMEPLFRTPGTVFVNCQYEDIGPELTWARDNLGVEILDFPDLDKRDDLERLAALIACFDLFVGTGTTTTEFAALLGCPTIYASPSNMNAYRNPAFTEKDMFYKDLQMIRPIPASDRAAMVKRMAALVAEAADRKRSSATIIPIPAAANVAGKAQA